MYSVPIDVAVAVDAQIQNTRVYCHQLFKLINKNTTAATTTPKNKKKKKLKAARFKKSVSGTLRPLEKTTNIHNSANTYSQSTYVCM